MPAAAFRIERLDVATGRDDFRAALALVLRRLPEEIAASKIALAVDVPPAALENASAAGELWRAVDARGGLSGAVWGQTQAPGVITVWLPQWLAEPEPSPGPDPLLEALCDSATAGGAALLQTLIHTDDADSARVLTAGGFQHLADLEFQSATCSDAAATGSDELEFPLVANAEREQLARLVDASYTGTLDCPALNGVRTGVEVLDEYDLIGAPRSDRWCWVRHGNENVGCLLLADHPEQDQAELVYMSLLPVARGRGWGATVARQALAIAASWQRSRVVLAVDAANHPARRIYDAAGFAPFAVRAAWIRVASRPTS